MGFLRLVRQGRGSEVEPVPGRPVARRSPVPSACIGTLPIFPRERPPVDTYPRAGMGSLPLDGLLPCPRARVSLLALRLAASRWAALTFFGGPGILNQSTGTSNVHEQGVFCPRWSTLTGRAPLRWRAPAMRGWQVKT